MPKCPAKHGLVEVPGFQCQQQQRLNSSRDVRALRASGLRATNLGEAPSFSAFITFSIPSRTTALEVIRASTEKAFFFFWTAATADSSLASDEISSFSKRLWRMPWEFSPLINASRMSSSRYCSALSAWKVHSYESNFKAWMNCWRLSAVRCFRVARRCLAKTSFFSFYVHSLV